MVSLPSTRDSGGSELLLVRSAGCVRVGGVTLRSSTSRTHRLQAEELVVRCDHLGYFLLFVGIGLELRALPPPRLCTYGPRLPA